jgi:hypothetical protein
MGVQDGPAADREGEGENEADPDDGRGQPMTAGAPSCQRGAGAGDEREPPSVCAIDRP